MTQKITVLELFAGTGSFSRVAREMGFRTFTVDKDARFSPDLVADVLALKVADLPPEFRNPSVVWASPPCQGFSVMNFRRNWVKPGFPRSPKAREGLALLNRTVELLKELRPKYFFVENPRGMMRKFPFMANYRRVTVNYCQYGFSYMKPTDIWTNCGAWVPRKPCRVGSSCHDRQPRGAKGKKVFSSGTGVQGLRDASERSVVPAELCAEILGCVRGVL